MVFSDDPVRDFLRYDSEREDAAAADLRRCPICANCGQPIKDEHLLDIDGDLYCMACTKELFFRSSANYMEED